MIGDIAGMEVTKTNFHPDRITTGDVDIKDLGLVQVIGHAKPALNGHDPRIDLDPTFERAFDEFIECSTVQSGEGLLSICEGFLLNTEKIE